MSFINSVLSFSIGSLTVWTLLVAVLLVLVGILLSKFVVRVTKKALARTTLDVSFQHLILIILRVVLNTLILLSVADHLGIPVTSLLTVLSLVGLAVSLAIQDTLANVVSGIILMASKTFASGDYVLTAGQEGTFVKIDLMHTHLLTADNKAVRIPNKHVQAAAIVNYSKEPLRRVEIHVFATYNAATQTVKDALLRAASRVETVQETPAPFAGLFAYQVNRVEYVLQAWTPANAYQDTFFALNERIREAFDENEIPMI